MIYKIENIELPTSRPGTISHAIKQLHVGQSFLIPFDDIKETKKTQAAVHTIAANLDEVKLTTRTEDEGLRVYRVPYEQPKVNQAEIVEDVEVETGEIPMSKKETIDGLRDLMNLSSSGVKASEIYGEPDRDIPRTDEWDGWSDELSTVDQDAGETVYYREHIKTRKRKELRRETYYG